MDESKTIDRHKRIRHAEKNLHRCMSRDVYVLRGRLTKLRADVKSGKAGVEKTLGAIEKSLDASVALLDKRKKSMPPVSFSDTLPINLKKDEIIQHIRNHQVIILSGETGSGKTTQIPKLCLEAGRGVRGMIACTQPRRIAALTVSARIAEELGQDTGRAVGCKIRFHENTSDTTLIKIMTDGILLAEAQQDRFLNDYDTIIVDEAHERSLNIDFILGILRDLLRKRKDLKVIITSATIDTEKFSRAFDDAPVIEVSGRTFPVELMYRPAQTPEDEERYVDRAVKAVDEIHNLGPWGDILIFMPTEADINECMEILTGRQYPRAVIMPLYARLSAADQKAIFVPVSGRKIVVATNVAETSITIPGIKYVVDTGLARIPRYTPRTRTTSLPVQAVSKSSADQRKGRCGRVENGICYRLFSEKDYESRPFFTSPEILRANLAEVILRMIALKLGEVERFPFIDPPLPKSIRDGYDTLVELGSIRQEPASSTHKKAVYALTNKGRIMARIPVDPTLSRMLIEAAKRGCLSDITVIISALSIRDPRERPQDKIQQAEQMHKVFTDPMSDFITFLNIWNRFQEDTGGSRKAAQIKVFTAKYFLSFLRMREWLDIHGQLTTILAEHNLADETSLPDEKTDKDPVFKPRYRAIHQSIVTGYLGGIAVKKDKNIYQATRGREAMIFPGSGLFNGGGQWIVAAEMVETSRLFARCVATIDNGWLEELGGDCVTYAYSGAHWSAKKGAVFARRQASLFGLVISEKSVPYGPVSPDEATRIFIQSALVEGEVNLNHHGKEWDFLRHNLALMDEVRSMEDRVRRRDILISEAEVAAFYEERLRRVYDTRSLARMIKQKGSGDFLKMYRDMLIQHPLDPEEAHLFPEQAEVKGRRFSLSYCFDPGKDDDGVTVKVPTASLGAVSPQDLDWMVPGMLREKTEALLKNLPKEYRKKLVPITATVGRFMDHVAGKKEPVTQGRSLCFMLAQWIHDRFGMTIPGSAWTLSGLSPHLVMRVAVLDAQGKVLAQGRDPKLLTQDFSHATGDDGFDQAKARWEKDQVRPWDCGDIPESVDLTRGKTVTGLAFPGLCVEEGRVSLRLFRVKSTAVKHHKNGVRSLFETHLAPRLKSLKKDLALKGNHRLYANYLGGDAVLSGHLYERVLTELFRLDIRSERAFMAHAEKTASAIYAKGRELHALTLSILEAFHQARSLIYSRELKEAPGNRIPDVGLDLRKDLDHLVPPSFLELYDLNRLTHLPRLINGIRIRAERAFAHPDKDRLKAKDITPFMDTLAAFIRDLSPDASDDKRDRIEDFFWMIQEYKISIFAQELKTPVKISKKKLEALASEIRRMI